MVVISRPSHCKSEARIHSLAVEEDCASATRPLVTTHLRARQMEVLAQAIEQRHPRIQDQIIAEPVHFQAHRDENLRTSIIVVL